MAETPEIRELIKMPDGNSLRGYEIDFELVKDAWTEYKLEDGTRVRTKHVLAKVFRLVNDEGALLFDEFGQPQVIVNGSVVVSTSNAPQQHEE